MRKNNMITRKAAAILLTAALAAAMAACNADGNNSGDPKRKDAASIIEENKGPDLEAAPQEEVKEAVLSTKTAYPLTITTYGSDGAVLETVYEKAPQRVVAVYQGSVETMLALGLEDHIAATAGLDNEVPKEWKAAFSKTNYLDEFTPSLETVTMLEPDMIFSWGSLFGEKTLGDAGEWAQRGVNPYMNTNTHPQHGGQSYPKTLENEYQDILNIGKIFDVQDKALALVEEMQATIDEVAEKAAELEKKPTALILESGKDSYTNYGADSLCGDMLTKICGTLANPAAPSIGKEDIVAANPDVIFVVYMPYAGDDPKEVEQAKLKEILEEEAYQSLDAVKNGRVVPIMLSEMYASATRTKDGIITLARGLYPELELH